jgi:hypothetical protein
VKALAIEAISAGTIVANMAPAEMIQARGFDAVQAAKTHETEH